MDHPLNFPRPDNADPSRESKSLEAKISEFQAWWDVHSDAIDEAAERNRRGRENAESNIRSAAQDNVIKWLKEFLSNGLSLEEACGKIMSVEYRAVSSHTHQDLSAVIQGMGWPLPRNLPTGAA